MGCEEMSSGEGLTGGVRIANAAQNLPFPFLIISTRIQARLPRIARSSFVV